MVYSWKNFNYSVDANVVGKEFEKIEKKYGALTNENVLKVPNQKNHLSITSLNGIMH